MGSSLIYVAVRIPWIRQDAHACYLRNSGLLIQALHDQRLYPLSCDCVVHLAHNFVQSGTIVSVTYIL